MYIFFHCFNFGEPFSGTWLLFKIFLESYWVFSYHYKLFNHNLWMMRHSDWMTGCRQLLQYVYIWRCGDAAHTPDDRWEDPNTVLINDFSGKWDAGENLVVLTLPFQLPHTRDATLCLCTLPRRCSIVSIICRGKLHLTTFITALLIPINNS